MEAPILYLSDTLVAVDKPAGIIVHGDGTGQPTLTDLVRTALDAEDTPEPSSSRSAELQALNRLDRDTSGVVLFSRSKATQAAYDRLIAEHAVEKRYLAIVVGRVPWGHRTFTQPIGRDRHDARRMRVSRTGKPAVTHAKRIAESSRRGRTFTLLSVTIETGRKHQIRVHLSHSGLPILGDGLYGRPDPRGLMLHARSLAFSDPVTGERVRIEAPVPQRFERLFPVISLV